MTTPPFPAPTPPELAVVSAQLGRPARGVVGIAARCACGNPTVVATTPRLPDGTPFPTFYYLTHPAATAAMSTLEATQVMPELAALLAEDESVAAAYLAAHEAYLADRARFGEVPEIDREEHVASSRNLHHEADHTGCRGTSIHDDDIPDLAEPVADGIEDGAPGQARGENPLCAHLSSVVGGSGRRRDGRASVRRTARVEE